MVFDTKTGSTGPILVEMKRNLTDICEKLIFSDDVLLRLSFEREKRDTSIATILDKFDRFKAAIERAVPRGHSRGRPAGIKQYPELDALVFHLELSAQLAGGKFTVHKKNGCKGTIIEALNLLRNVLRANVGTGKKDAAAIPVPAKHPFSTYARAINDARKAAAATLGMAGRGSPRGRRLCPPALAGHANGSRTECLRVAPDGSDRGRTRSINRPQSGKFP